MLKNWTHRELDGTLLIFVISGVYILTVIFTFISPEFAALTTTTQILEIAENMLIFMAGYAFKNASVAAAEKLGGFQKKENE